MCVPCAYSIHYSCVRDVVGKEMNVQRRTAGRRLGDPCCGAARQPKISLFSRHKSRLELAILAFKLYKNNYTVDGPLGSLRLTVTARKRGH